MAYVKDIIQGTTLTQSSEGWQDTRIFIVDGIGGTAEGRAYQAAIAAGVPRYGDPHPSIPGIQATDITVNPASGSSNTQYNVQVTYSLPSDEELTSTSGENGPLTVEYISTTTEESSHYDVNGEFMSVGYSGPFTRWFIDGTGTVYSNSNLLARLVQFHKADFLLPRLQISAKRTENTPPVQLSKDFTGTVNTSSYNGWPAGTLLCLGVDIRQLKETYEVTYRFAYAAETWRYKATTVIAGRVPEQVTEGNGIEYYNVYTPANFNTFDEVVF